VAEPPGREAGWAERARRGAARTHPFPAVCALCRPRTPAMSGGPNQLETELNTYRAIQKEIGKVQNSISSAGTQILENELVLKVRPLARHLPVCLGARRGADRRLSASCNVRGRSLRSWRRMRACSS
jgi:hypothetical protein